MAEIISKVRNFSKSKLQFSTPHLLTMQKETWEDFWKVRVKELLEEINYRHINIKSIKTLRKGEIYNSNEQINNILFMR